MTSIFIIGIASFVSFISILFLPVNIALPLNGLATLTILIFLARQFLQFRKLTVLAKQLGLTENGTPDNIVGALSKKLSDHSKLLDQIVHALDNLAERTDDTKPIAIEGSVGDALRAFRGKLVQLKIQEERQHWASRGLANLNNIKKSNNSLEEYGYHAISTLVKYVGGNQASFYLLDNENEHLTLLATFAYDKRKYTDGTVLIHRENGLLGQCIQERDIIYLTQVPAGYVRITSGLGEAPPRVLIIIPLLYRDQIYGAIEMASFQSFEKYQIEFCRSFAEGIAGELSGIQMQERTSKLLQQAQLHADQLRSQEEELRQNMEEMAATHEEMSRHESTLREKIAEIDGERAKHQAILETCVDGVISFNEEGVIQFFNKAAQEMFGYQTKEIMNQSVSKIFDFRIIKTNEAEPQLITKTGNMITSRTEVDAVDSQGNIISLLLTVAQVKLKGKSLFTLFAQKISVDLF